MASKRNKEYPEADRQAGATGQGVGRGLPEDDEPSAVVRGQLTRIDALAKPRELDVSGVRADGGTQPRAAMNTEIVAEYADAIREGAQFPPVVVFKDGTDYWLADGFHRLEAHRAAGCEAIQAYVQAGTQRDAVLYSVGANADHGLRRSNEDKRRAVERLLRDEEWVAWSDREIAKRCRVDHKTVARVRNALETSGEIPRSTERTYERDGQTVTVNTENIGKNQPKRQMNQVWHKAGHTVRALGPHIDGRYICSWLLSIGEVRKRENIEDYDEALRWFAATVEEAQAAVAEAAAKAAAQPAEDLAAGDRVIDAETGEVGTVKAVGHPVPGVDAYRVYVYWDGGHGTVARMSNQLRKLEPEGEPTGEISSEEPEPARTWPPDWLKAYRLAAEGGGIPLVQLGGILVALEDAANRLARSLGAPHGDVMVWRDGQHNQQWLAAVKISRVDEVKLGSAVECHVIHIANAGELKMLADQQLETLDVTALLAAKEEREAFVAEPAGVSTSKHDGDELPDWVRDEAPAPATAPETPEPDIKPVASAVTPDVLADYVLLVKQGINRLAEEAETELQRAVYRSLPPRLTTWSLAHVYKVLDALCQPDTWSDLRHLLRDVDLADQAHVDRSLTHPFMEITMKRQMPAGKAAGQ